MDSGRNSLCTGQAVAVIAPYVLPDPLTAATEPLAALELVAHRQNGVFTLAQARQCRVADAVIAQQVRTRGWIPQRRGVYVDRAELARCAEDPARLHVLAVQAFLLVHQGDLVVSHTSAAALHELPVLQPYGTRPVLTLHRPDAAPPARPGDRLAASVPLAQRARASGMTVTNRARTVADLARTQQWEAAVVMADAALRAGESRDAVLELLDGPCRGWPGAAAARRVLRFADRRAESALESRARCWFASLDLPAPELQVEIFDQRHRFVARVDFLLQGRTICETDGRAKYLGEDNYSGGDEPGGNALWAEKQREDRLRELGFEVVRGYWSDGADLTRLDTELHRAFARAALDPSPLRGHQRPAR